MTKNNGTRRSLVLSIMSLVLCLAMLLGTTFAWFTDSAKSGKNTIVSGNLDIEIEYSKDMTAWNTIEGATDLFGDVALWEPGAASVCYIRVKNVGSLALKYALTVSVDSETAGINAAGESFKLSDFILFGQEENVAAAYAERKDAVDAVSATAGKIADGYSASGEMLAGDPEKVISLVVFLPESVGNEANYKTGTTAPEISLGVKIVATQLSYESDGFNNEYDLITPWLGSFDDAGLAANTDATAKTVKIKSAEQLASFAKAVNAGATYNNFTATLENDVDLNGVEWIQIEGAGKNVVFDGNGKTVSNLKVTHGHNAGFFATSSGCTVKNLTFDNAFVSAVGRAAVIAGHGMNVIVDNCTVKNSTLTTSPAISGGVYDDGDKAGAMVGYLSGESTAKVTNCTVEDTTVKGYRDIGALVGYAGGTFTVTDNTVKNCTVIEDNSHNYKNYTTDAEYDANEIIGEAGTYGTVSGNTATDVTVIVGVDPAGAVAELLNNATAGETVKVPVTDDEILLPAVPEGVTLRGNGKDTVLTTNKSKINKNDVTISDVTIKGAGASGTEGMLNISGDNTKLSNVIFKGNGSGRAIVVSTGASNEGTVFEGVEVTGASRGIQFWSLSGDSVIKNCVLDISGYTFNIDAVKAGATLTVEDTVLNGWTSYTDGIESVSFKNCKLGFNTYAYCRPYSNTSFDGCEFTDGACAGNNYLVNAGGNAAITVAFNNCTHNGVAVTASNVLQLLDIDGFNANAIVTVNGTAVSLN